MAETVSILSHESLPPINRWSWMWRGQVQAWANAQRVRCGTYRWSGRICAGNRWTGAICRPGTLVVRHSEIIIKSCVRNSHHFLLTTFFRVANRFFFINMFLVCWSYYSRPVCFHSICTVIRFMRKYLDSRQVKWTKNRGNCLTENFLIYMNFLTQYY
jgi:hypothetical protein